MAGEFAQLLPCSWRDIQFPIASMSVSFAQDLVEHKYWGVDGASVEATGRGAMMISATIPFVNGIVPGNGEKWGILYPTTFREFVKAFGSRATGTLKHPEFGDIFCKPHTLEFSHDAQRRDGVEVRAQWVETHLDGDDSTLTDGNSPVTEAELAALDLDASKEDLKKLVPKAPEFEESFASMMNKITGVVDRVTVSASLATGRIGAVVYRIHQLEESVDRARTALTWPITDALERMKSSSHDVAAKLAAAERTILRYTVPAKTTLAGLQAALPSATIADLMRLNPILMARPDVPAGAVVKYYAPKTE
jgi:prophage DNA circulation protein